ncbi:MAG: FmdB family zinc ribbon protein [Acidimicrobiales bacterium]
MPTYEYRCKACGHHLEIVQAFTDDALTQCPSCEAAELRKVFGSVGISFKGSGFYKNDSRSKTASSSSSTTSSASSSGSDGASTSGNGSSGSSSSSDSSSSTPAASPAKPAATKTSDAKSA